MFCSGEDRTGRVLRQRSPRTCSALASEKLEASKPSTTEQTSECNPPPSVNAAALHCRCPNICAVKLRYRRPAMPPLRYSTTLQLTTLAASAALQRPARRCTAATALPLPTHCTAELRCAALRRQHSAAELRSSHAAAANTTLPLPMPCAAELRCSSAPLTCEDTTTLQRCAAAANA